MHAGRMHADTSRTGAATDDVREPTREREPRTDEAPVRDAPDAAPVVPASPVDTARLVVPPAVRASSQPLPTAEAAPAKPRHASGPLPPPPDPAVREDAVEGTPSAPLASRGPTDEELRALDRILQALSASQATAAHGPTPDALDDLDRLMREAPKGRAAPSAEELFRADLAAAAAEPPRDFQVDVGSNAPPVRRTAPPAPPPPAASVSKPSPTSPAASSAPRNAHLERAPAIAARETCNSGEPAGLDLSASRGAAVAPLADTRARSQRRTWTRSLPRLSRRELIAWSAAYAAALAIGAGVGLYNSTRHAAPGAERGTPPASVETTASSQNPPATAAAVAAPRASSDPAIDPRANRRAPLDASRATGAPQVRTPLSASPQNSLATTPSSAPHNRGRADRASSVGAADAVGSSRARTGADGSDGRRRGRAAAASTSPTGASPLTGASIASIASTRPPVSPPPSLSTASASPSSASPSSASPLAASPPAASPSPSSAPSPAPPSPSTTAIRSSDSVADRPLTSAPAPAPAAAPTAVEREAFRVAADTKDTASISSLLARYERGYGALDSAAVASV